MPETMMRVIGYLHNNVDALVKDPRAKDYIKRYLTMYGEEEIGYLIYLNETAGEYIQKEILNELDKCYMKDIREKEYDNE